HGEGARAAGTPHEDRPRRAGRGLPGVEPVGAGRGADPQAGRDRGGAAHRLPEPEPAASRGEQGAGADAEVPHRGRHDAGRQGEGKRCARREEREPARAVGRMRKYVQAADDYARDVMAGRILACRYVRLACERHLDGREREMNPDYPYRLDASAATKVCRFVELMPHVKGLWARNRELIRLEPWQCFILVNVFGWLRKRDGLRRYRRVYIEVPRKNAKSTLTAAVANY